MPSPYEQRNFEIAKTLSQISEFDGTKTSFIDFVRKDIGASNKWLERVSVHMQSETVPEGNSDDAEYLSRFEVTKICPGEIQAPAGSSGSSRSPFMRVTHLL